MDSPDQPAPQHTPDIASSQDNGTAQAPDQEDAAAPRAMPDYLAAAQEMGPLAVDLARKMGPVAVIALASHSAQARNAAPVAPPPQEAPSSRSAQVTAAMAKVRVEQRRSMARRTPYGYRLGHPDGPHENAKRKRLPNGRKCNTPDRRPLVENRREMEILDAIIAGMRKHADLPLGKAAYQVAKALRWHEISNPRGGATWHSGSIKSIYKTAMAHRAKQHSAAHQGVSDGEQNI